MRTTQQAFHPMRGHMVPGMEIECENGDVLTLHQRMLGWEVITQRGERIGGLTRDAYEVTRLVVEYRPNA